MHLDRLHKHGLVRPEKVLEEKVCKLFSKEEVVGYNKEIPVQRAEPRQLQFSVLNVADHDDLVEKLELQKHDHDCQGKVSQVDYPCKGTNHRHGQRRASPPVLPPATACRGELASNETDRRAAWCFSGRVLNNAALLGIVDQQRLPGRFAWFRLWGSISVR